MRVELERLSEARRRLVASPHDRKSQLEVARWMFDHAQDQEGARWAQRILDEWPDDPEASRLLAGYHERRGETALANFYRLHAQSGARLPPMPRSQLMVKQRPRSHSAGSGADRRIGASAANRRSKMMRTTYGRTLKVTLIGLGLFALASVRLWP